MAKKPRQELKAFEAYLRHLYETSPYQPFTTEEIELILKSYGTPKDLKKYRNEKLVSLMKEIHDQQLAQAEAYFRDPSQIHSLGELFESTLTIKNIFISQLAQALEIPVEEIEAYVENRPPAQPLSEMQMAKIAEITGIAMDEIRRIAAETAKDAGTETPTQEKSALRKTPWPYPPAEGQSAVWAVRDEDS